MAHDLVPLSSEIPIDWWRRADSRTLPREAFAGASPGGRVPFVALMAFTSVLLLAPQALLPGLAALRPGLLTAATAAAAFLLDRIVRRRPLTPAPRETAIACALAVWATALVPFSYWPGGSAGFLLDVYFKTLVIFWLLPGVAGTAPRIRAVAWCLSLMAAPLAIFGISKYLSGQFIDTGAVHRIVSYDAPLTENPNDLALMLNLILPLTIALFLARRSAPAGAMLLALAGIDALGVIVSFSRAGFLTLLAIGLVYAWRLGRRRERGWVIAALILVLLAVPFLPSGYMDRLSTISDISSDPTGSAQARWADTMAALRFVARHPIVGAGAGMDALALNEVRGPLWKRVHNVYLEHAVDLGLPGLALFLLLFFGCRRAALSARRLAAGREDLREVGCLAEGVEISLLGFAVAAFFHPVAYHFYFYYIAGMALAVRAACAAASPAGGPAHAGS